MEKPLTDSEKIQLFDQLKMIGDDGEYFKTATALKLLKDDVMKLDIFEQGITYETIVRAQVTKLIDDMIGESE